MSKSTKGIDLKKGDVLKYAYFNAHVILAPTKTQPGRAVYKDGSRNKVLDLWANQNYPTDSESETIEVTDPVNPVQTLQEGRTEPDSVEGAPVKNESAGVDLDGDGKPDIATQTETKKPLSSLAAKLKK